MESISLADIKHEAADRFDPTDQTSNWSEIILDMQKGVDGIIEDANGLIGSQSEIDPSEVEALIQRVTIDHVQTEARSLLQNENAIFALDYLCRQLLGIHNRARALLDEPVHMAESFEGFIHNLGAEAPEKEAAVA